MTLQSIPRRLFGRLLEAMARNEGAGLRKTLWKGWYNLLARFWTTAEWTYMNYGYQPQDGDDVVSLPPEEEPDRPFIGLYHRVTGRWPLEGKRVLEVGCGRGGGCAHLARARAPREMVGLDYSGPVIQWARRRHQSDTAPRFEVGDAEALPFESGAFDVVVNVESSHCYANMDRFVEEVYRVLVPGGLFLWADMGTKAMHETFDGHLQSAGFQVEDRTVITPGVLASLEETHDQKMAMTSRIPLGKTLVREFAGTRSSILFKGLSQGAVIYRTLAARRPLA
jgi:SAM-dependent methyltransferase